MERKLNGIDRQRCAIVTTYKCNWNCEYCIIDTHDKQKNQPIYFVDLLKKINSVPNGFPVTLCGGEPGMLSPKEVKKVFLILENKNCEIDLLTNGLFIKRYPEYLSRLDKVEYHCAEELKNQIEFPNLDQNQFNYLVIVTKRNYKEVDDFLDRYPKIKFKLVCNSKYGERLPRPIGTKLLMKNKYRIDKNSFNFLFSYQCRSKVI